MIQLNRTPTQHKKTTQNQSNRKWYNILGRSILDHQIKKVTLHMGREGSFKLTSKLSHFKSKCTIFLECKYSIPKAASIAIISRFRRSRCLRHIRAEKSNVRIRRLQRTFIIILTRGTNTRFTCPC